jgi:hypothetical protein
MKIFFSLNINYPTENEKQQNDQENLSKYVVGFSSENLRKDWKKAISQRIDEIKSYSSVGLDLKNKNPTMGKLPAASFDKSFIFVQKDENINHLKMLEKKQLEIQDKLRNIIYLFTNQNNLKDKFHFEFNLNHLGFNLLVKENQKFSLEFRNFALITKVNELLLHVTFELSEINFKFINTRSLHHSVLISDHGYSQHTNIDLSSCSILFNKLSNEEKLISIDVKVYNTEIFNFITNPPDYDQDTTTLEKLMEKINLDKNTNEKIILMIKNLSKTEIDFKLSNMSFIFNPNLINLLINYLTRIFSSNEAQENTKKENNERLRKLKNENISISDSQTQISENEISPIINNTSIVPDQISSHSSLRLFAIFRSLDLTLINKKTNLKIFSLNLGESVVSIDQKIEYMEVKLNLGNFQINEHLNFPHKIDSTTALLNERREIFGLADKQKNSSLRVELCIYNQGYCPIKVNNIKITTKINVFLESIKLNLIWKVVMRFIDTLIYDIIPTFSSSESEKKEIILENQEINVNKNFSNEIKKLKLLPLETFELKIQIDNPTIIVSDLLNEKLFYKLDFGKIFVKNNVVFVNTDNTQNLSNSIYYYQMYEIELKNTLINCSDGYNICQPLNTNITYSSLSSLNSDSIIDEKISTTHPDSEVRVYVKIFDFELRRLDYLNIIKLVENNFSLDDGMDNILFDFKKEKAVQSEPKSDQVHQTQQVNAPAPIVNSLNKFKFALKFYNEVFKIKALDEKMNYVQFILTNCDFNMEAFTHHMSMEVTSKNIIINDNTISILSNKKGVEKIMSTKNYSQFHLYYIEESIKGESRIDVSLIDLKFLLKLDLINFITDFIKQDKKEKINENKLSDENLLTHEIEVNTDINKIDTNQNIQKVESSAQNKKMIINVTILNNVIFLKSQSHFEAQEILACEGDIIAKISIGKLSLTDNTFIDKDKVYSIHEKMNINFALQNFNLYKARILSFESDFENIYTGNKRNLIEPINLFANVKNKDIKKIPDINNNSQQHNSLTLPFNKNEIFVDMDNIKMKVSYSDFFFILNSVMLNINEIIRSQNKEEFRDQDEVEKKIDKKNLTMNKNISNTELQNENLGHFENSLEVYLDLHTIEVLLINDLNDMYCPILQILISNLDTTLFLDLNSDMHLKAKTEILINYFNYKISLWEPLIENFDLVLLKRKENTFLNINSDVNLNITEEFIFLLKNSIESFKINYKKNYLEISEHLQPEEEESVSNHILINYSGAMIFISKFLFDGTKAEISIKNGESFDLNKLVKSGGNSNSSKIYSHLEMDKEISLSMESIFDEIKFIEKNLNLKNFHLSNLKEHQAKTLRDGGIFYNVELKNIRRNYIFFSKFTIENHTDLKFILMCSEGSYMELKPGNKLGIRDYNVRNNTIELTLLRDGSYVDVIYNEIMEKLNSGIGYINLKFSGGDDDTKQTECVLNLHKDNLQIEANEFEIFKLKIYPTFVVENFLSFPLKILTAGSTHLQMSPMNINLNSNDEKYFYFDDDYDFKKNIKFEINGKEEGVNKRERIRYVSGELYELENHVVVNTDVNRTNDTNRNIEKTVIIPMYNINSPDENFVIKMNFIREHGVMKLFVYSDYLIINTTPFEIFPLIADDINGQISSFHPQKVKFKHLINNDNIVDSSKISTNSLASTSSYDYFSVKNFEYLQLDMLDKTQPNLILKSEQLRIIPENYAYVKEINFEGSSDKNANPLFYQFVLERYIKYVKFTSLKKIDMLIIKPKYKIQNNLRDDLEIFTLLKDNQESTKIIQNHTEDLIHSRNSKIKFRVKSSTGLLSNESEWINLESALSEQILLNFNSEEKCKINIQTETDGFTSVLLISPADKSNNRILLDNQTEYQIKMYQITKDEGDFKNIYTLSSGQSRKPFQWNKIFISKYLKIDLCDPSTGNSLDYYVLEYDSVDSQTKQNKPFTYRFAKKDEILLRVFMEGNVQRFIFQKKKSLDVDKILRRGETKNITADNKVIHPAVTLIKIISQMILNINAVNICIVNYDYRVKNLRTELANLSITKMSLIYIENIVNNINRFKTVELKIKNLQLDNLSNNQDSPYKVNIFKIAESADSLHRGRVDEDNHEPPIVHFLLEIKSDLEENYNDDHELNGHTEIKHPRSQNVYIEKLEFLIQSIGICLDSEFLYEILKFTKSLQINVDTSLYYKNNGEILDIVLSNFATTSKPLLKSTSNAQKIFINTLRTSPINLLFSYKNISNQLFDELNIKSSIIQNIMDVFSSNEKVNIQLKAIEMNKVFGNSGEISEKIMHYYYYNLLGQALKLFFSVDILGNPLNLLQNLGSGVRDFFYLPIQGFINGPFEFLYGSISGTRSLVSHALGGALDSTEKIAKSVGKNLLKLSNSDDYLRERQNLFSEASHNSLLKMSFKIIFLGVKYGTRDLLYLPYLYYSNQGVLYLPKGIFMGLTSIFVKPISSALDFISYFSGGLSKRFLQNYEITFSNLKRTRNQRIFWGVNKYIKSCDFENSFTQGILEKEEDFMKIANESLFNSNAIMYRDIMKSLYIKKVIFFKTKDGMVTSAIFINDYILFFNCFSLRVEKIIEIKNLFNLIIDSLSVKIVYKDPKLGMANLEYEIIFLDEEIKENLLNFIFLIWNKQTTKQDIEI